MDKLALLKTLSFGARVAEDELSELAGYFVETDQWNRIFRGEVDIVRGEKGAGKSAIYLLLTTKADELFDENILLVAAETPRGTPVFKELITEPPTSEFEFVGMWKLYLVSLIGQRLNEFSLNSSAANELFNSLKNQNLLERDLDLSRILRAVRDYARRWLTPQAVEAGIRIDPNTGLPTGFTTKITPAEPDSKQRAEGYVSVDHLIQLANRALESVKFQVWVLLDRLDVAFAETHELERNALRALFRVYLDIAGATNIKLKIFLRSDIWKRIVDGGFREASHITKIVVLDWTPASLLNLIIRRLLKNDVLVQHLAINRDAVLQNFAAQQALFYRLFPQQVEQGTRKPSTFDWMISRCADGTGKTAPREIIHLLTSLRDQEIALMERGGLPPSDEQLFDRSVFKSALSSVSEARLVQNLYAEYPDLRRFLAQLQGEKTEQTVHSLAAIWKISEGEALSVALRAVEIGFFEPRGSREEPTFWVPFLYRDALQMSQGLAEESN